MKSEKNQTYIKWGITALVVVFISILLVVIFTNLPGFFAMLDSMGKVLSPVIYGAVFAFLLHPVMRAVDARLYRLLQKKEKTQGSLKKLSRSISIVFALVFALLIIYAFFAMLLPQLQDSIQGIVDNAPRYYRSIENWLSNLLEDNPQITEYIHVLLENVRGFINNWAQTTLASDVQTVLTTLTSSVVSVVRGALNIFIGLCVSIYILLAKEKLKAQGKKIVIATFSGKVADRMLYLGREANKIFSGFLIGKLIDSVIIGIICYIGMLILRMPYPELIATVIGVTNVIPFFGPIIGAIPCTFLILLVNPLQALYFVIFILVLQQVDGNIIGPKILGTSVGISGLWVLISITVATSIFGFAGMVLGVPMFAFIYLIISDSVKRRLVNRGLTTKTEEYLLVSKVEDLPQMAKDQTEEV